MKIIIDTREQKPYQFPLEHEIVSRGLKTGDYSVEGFEDTVVVERKGLGDLIHCLTTGRARFRRQLGRLRKIPYRTVIIDTTIYQISRKRYVGYLKPDDVLANISELSVEYKVMFQFGDSPALASRLCLAFLNAGTKKARQPKC